MKPTRRTVSRSSPSSARANSSLVLGRRPLYLQLKEDLLQQIEDGTLNPGDPLPSERELCLQYNVSSITARRSLRELVTEGRVVRHVGVGTFVNSDRKRARLGLIVFGFDESDWQRNRDIFGDLIGGIAAAAWERNAVFSLVRAPLDTRIARLLALVAREKEYDGLILRTAGDFSAQDVAPLLAERLPFVVIKRSIPGLNVNCVVVDERKGGYLATQHLVSLGHRHITFVGPTSLSVAQQRFQGFEQALEEAGMATDPDCIQIVPTFSQADGYEGAKRIFARCKPTAIFASADVLAEGCYQACSEAGLSIPHDISIVGHDDYSAALRLRPLLTTVRISYYDLGVRAIHLLVNALETPSRSAQKETSTSTLIIRESTAPPATV